MLFKCYPEMICRLYYSRELNTSYDCKIGKRCYRLTVAKEEGRIVCTFWYVPLPGTNRTKLPITDLVKQQAIVTKVYMDMV